MAQNATWTWHPTYLREIKAAAQRSGIIVVGVEARARDDFERPFAALTKARAQGLIVLPHPATFTHQTHIVGLAAKHRLPAIYPSREFIASGASWRIRPAARKCIGGALSLPTFPLSSRQSSDSSSISRPPRPSA